ncbi:MAG: prepilin-type N-terminal cleavage/methylation domain-containing protein [Deltaproteobacteria bacterium]|nr:prepilin-type N-terminal cleavage/methylation domain-containing protein [Deltaproteobacteria bacterium]
MRHSLDHRLIRPRDDHRVQNGRSFAEGMNAPEAVRGLHRGPVHAALSSNDGGFTLIELLLVLVIFSLSIAIVSPYISSGLTGVTVKSTTKKVVATLKRARVLAMRDRRNYYARFTAKQVVIEPAKGTGPKKEMPIPDDVKIEARDGAVIVFYPGGGSSGGVFEVKGPMDRGNYIIRVEPSTGSVKAYPSHGKIHETDDRT